MSSFSIVRVIEIVEAMEGVEKVIAIRECEPHEIVRLDGTVYRVAVKSQGDGMCYNVFNTNGEFITGKLFCGAHWNALNHFKRTQEEPR